MSANSPAAILFDVNGNPVVINTEGGHLALSAVDEESRGLLRDILDELKTMNVHLANMTGLELGDD